MVTPSRLAVARVLRGVFENGHRVPDGWDADLSAEDAALAQAILGHCLRRWGRLHAWFQSRLKNPGRGAPLGTFIPATLGLAQLAWLPGVSAHAAVHEAVELAGHPELGFLPHKGLINAVLRRASTDRDALRAELEALDPALDRSPFATRALGAALAPRGQGAAHLEALWTRLQQVPTLTFRALGPAPDGLLPDPACPGALRLAPGTPFPRTWLQEGGGMVQDLSSQALMAFDWGGEPRRILDTCAAPGGKTTALARRWPGASLTALERDPRRADRLRENLNLRGIRADVLPEEATAWLRRPGDPFDLILVDAPCSASGTLQKHPELPWIGDRVDLGRLVRLQASLLEAALARLAPGGLLLYAVCSWFPEEGLAHREAALGSHPDLRPAEVWPAPFGLVKGPSSCFLPDPLAWDGEGFQAFALTRRI
jgi:16S rRNA (cytosine967-C5)-methyltransferase